MSSKEFLRDNSNNSNMNMIPVNVNSLELDENSMNSFDNNFFKKDLR